MRALADLVSVAGGVVAIFGLIYRRLIVKPRRQMSANAERVKQLEAENREIDKTLDDLTKPPNR